MAVLTRVLLVLAAVLAPAGPPAAAAPLQLVDDRFQEEAVLEHRDSPTAIRCAPPPDGRIFVASKSGTVSVYESGSDQEPLLAADLSEEVHDFWDRGLLGMALDPAFAVNGRLYVLYTRDAVIGGSAPRWGDTCPDPPGATAAGCVISGALARITVDRLGVATEITTLIDDEWCQQFPSTPSAPSRSAPPACSTRAPATGQASRSATGARSPAPAATRRTPAGTRRTRVDRCARRTCAPRRIRRVSRERSSGSIRRRVRARPAIRSRRATRTPGG